MESTVLNSTANQEIVLGEKMAEEKREIDKRNAYIAKNVNKFTGKTVEFFKNVNLGEYGDKPLQKSLWSLKSADSGVMYIKPSGIMSLFISYVNNNDVKVIREIRIADSNDPSGFKCIKDVETGTSVFVTRKINDYKFNDEMFDYLEDNLIQVIKNDSDKLLNNSGYRKFWVVNGEHSDPAFKSEIIIARDQLIQNIRTRTDNPIIGNYKLKFYTGREKRAVDILFNPFCFSFICFSKICLIDKMDCRTNPMDDETLRYIKDSKSELIDQQSIFSILHKRREGERKREHLKLDELLSKNIDYNFDPYVTESICKFFVG